MGVGLMDLTIEDSRRITDALNNIMQISASCKSPQKEYLREQVRLAREALYGWAPGWTP